jgi:signal peptidase I
MSAVNNAVVELIESHLCAGKMIQFTVPTWSMWPLLAPGDRVLVQSVVASELCIGDIVVGKIEETPGDMRSAWFVHRLIGTCQLGDSMGLVTKGDAVPLADKPWSTVLLSGRVLTIQKQGSSQMIDLTSRRARFVARVMAWLSGLQWRTYSQLSKIVGRVVGKLNRLIGKAGVYFLAERRVENDLR